jgi:hypothetical protein
MKRLISIFIVLFVVQSATMESARATYTLHPEDAWFFNSASYGRAPYFMWEAYVRSYLSMGNPNIILRAQQWGQSGGNLSSDCNSNMMKWTLPYAAKCTGTVNVAYMATENGGIHPGSAQLPFVTNLNMAPGTMFDGHTMTNELGYCDTHSNTWVFHLVGAIPDGDSFNEDRNNTLTNYARATGRIVYDMFHGVTTNGFTSPTTGTNLFGFYAGGHPYPAGHLIMATVFLLSLGVDTNVNSSVLHWADASIVSTNHCVVSSVSRSGNTMSWVFHADRHAMGYDIPHNSNTNDCRDAFRIWPALSNAFWEGFQVPDMPDGNFELDCDGHFDCFLTGADLRSGKNFFTDFNNQIGKQRLENLDRTREQEGVDRNTMEYHFGGFGVLGTVDTVGLQSNEGQAWINGKRGDDLINDSQVAMFVDSVRTNYDTYINASAQPTNHTFTIKPRFNGTMKFRIRKRSH